jgi:ParB family chromosome partitioning protein
VTLEQLMALAITDDHAAQEAAFYDAPYWQRGASALRERLIEREIDATHPLARFVGLDAYTAAGGGIRRDLFAEDDAGVYLIDAALLERLVREKLDALAEDVRTEGWAWVESTPQVSYADLQAFHSAPRQQREPVGKEERRIASLRDRLEKTDAALQGAYEAEEEERAEALQARREQLAGALHAAQVGLLDYAPDIRAVAGAIVTVDWQGEAVIHRGLLREAEAKALRTLERLRQTLAGGEGVEGGPESEDAEPPKAVNLSDRLAQRLSAHRTAALQIEVARHPQVALAALVHGLVQTVLQEHHYGHAQPLGVRLAVKARLGDLAPDWPESPAVIAQHELQQAWRERLPQDSGELFSALQAMPQDELVQLLAVCVAASVDVVTPRAVQHQPGTELAQAVGLDMAAWWKPTAEGYFNHVSKAVILEAVQQFAPEQVTRLSTLKKADIASEAERLAYGTGWMPVVFKAEGPEVALEETQEQDAPADAEAVADEHAEVLAA